MKYNVKLLIEIGGLNTELEYMVDIANNMSTNELLSIDGVRLMKDIHVLKGKIEGLVITLKLFENEKNTK